MNLNGLTFSTAWGTCRPAGLRADTWKIRSVCPWLLTSQLKTTFQSAKLSCMVNKETLRSWDSEPCIKIQIQLDRQSICPWLLFKSHRTDSLLSYLWVVGHTGRSSNEDFPCCVQPDARRKARWPHSCLWAPTPGCRREGRPKVIWIVLKHWSHVPVVELRVFRLSVPEEGCRSQEQVYLTVSLRLVPHKNGTYHWYASGIVKYL